MDEVIAGEALVRGCVNAVVPCGAVDPEHERVCRLVVVGWVRHALAEAEVDEIPGGPDVPDGPRHGQLGDEVGVQELTRQRLDHGPVDRAESVVTGVRCAPGEPGRGVTVVPINGPQVGAARSLKQVGEVLVVRCECRNRGKGRDLGNHDKEHKFTHLHRASFGFDFCNCGLWFQVPGFLLPTKKLAQVREIFFEYEPDGARLLGGVSKGWSTKIGNHDDLRAGVECMDLGRCSDSIGLFHPDVHQHIIRSVLCIGLEGFAAVGTFNDCVIVRTDGRFNRPSHRGIVINDQNSHVHEEETIV